MTTSVRILSTSTVDSSPAILLIAPDGSKTLVNCGEGCQRIFLEFGQKVSSVHRVCLTHLSHTSLGGLPGMILTSADVTTAAAISSAKRKAGSINEHNKNDPPSPSAPIPNKRLAALAATETLSGLDIFGPKGTQSFIHSLRHFMRREAFELRVHEGVYHQEPQCSRPTKKQKKKGITSTDGSSGDFSVQTIPCSHVGEQQALSFVFTTPPIQGKFLVDKAKELGIPPGPLYAKLKSGQDVTFVHPGTGQETKVESHQVVEVGSPGVSVAVLYYPNLDCLSQLQASEALTTLHSNNGGTDANVPTIELVVSITSTDVFQSIQCQTWVNTFNDRVEHVFLSTDIPDTTTATSGDSGTPFHSACAGAICRSELSSDIYIAPNPFSINASQEMGDGELEISSPLAATPLLEYTLIPRPKKGFSNHSKSQQHRLAVEKHMRETLERSGAVEFAHSLTRSSTQSKPSQIGEIIFTGTGSAIPCKHRNVSGIYHKMSTGNAMLLDIGEGTIGQLLRAKSKEDRETTLLGICAVWISHPHADHHLGILRLLAERNSLKGKKNINPIIVVAPPCMRSFLREYEDIDRDVVGSYEFLDCRDVSTKAQPSRCTAEQLQINQRLLNRLNLELGVTALTSVPVAHCANSYAVIIHGSPFGTIAYSGDCRPSMAFAEAAQGVDLLIHEATFTDGMEAEAVVKRHSTVGEAMHVARKMKAKALVLTHFSQRYPKIPPVSSVQDEVNVEMPIVFAFDFLKLTTANCLAASTVTPAVRLLYPENGDGEIDDGTNEMSAEGALNIPGLFAENSLL